MEVPSKFCWNQRVRAFCEQADERHYGKERINAFIMEMFCIAKKRLND